MGGARQLRGALRDEATRNELVATAFMPHACAKQMAIATTTIARDQGIAEDSRREQHAVREEKRFGDLAKKSTRSRTGSTRGKYIYTNIIEFSKIL
jgi:hypothetical protein